MIFQRPNGIPTRSSSKKPSPSVSIPLSSTTSSQCPERQTSPIRISSTYISWIAPKQDARFRSPGKNDTSIPTLTVHPSKSLKSDIVIITHLRVFLCALRNSEFPLIQSSKIHRPGSASLCHLRAFAVQILPLSTLGVRCSLPLPLKNPKPKITNRKSSIHPSSHGLHPHITCRSKRPPMFVSRDWYPEDTVDELLAKLEL